MSGAKTAEQTGLRERKKLKTMTAIQEQALRLFAEQGYQATTIEQIAAAAEVSPSTFFRYFSTKKAVALYDSLDPLLVESFKKQPVQLNVIQALRGAFRTILDEMPKEELEHQLQRGELVLKESELQAAIIEEFARNIDMLAGLIAERVHSDVADPAVRTLAGAIIGTLLSVILQGFPAQTKDYFQRFDQALAELEGGLLF